MVVINFLQIVQCYHRTLTLGDSTALVIDYHQMVIIYRRVVTDHSGRVPNIFFVSQIRHVFFAFFTVVYYKVHRFYA